MHLDMNKDLLRINNYMQVPQITPKHPVSILKADFIQENRPTIAVGRLEIGLVGAGLKDRVGRSGCVLPRTHLNGAIFLDI